MNVSLWIKALRVIPRISKEEWEKLDVVSRWLVATRSAVFVMTFISASIGGILAYKDGNFNMILWILTTLGLVLAHATSNLINDLVDHLKGVDRKNYFRARYGPQPLEHGLMGMKELLIYVLATGLVALAIGLYLVHIRGSLALVLMLAGAFFVMFYTYPLKYIGLGEFAVILVWGPLMVGGTYFVITGSWSWDVVLASLPYALGVSTVLFGKHIDKYDDDLKRGIRTFPVVIGKENARRIVLSMILLQYAFVIYLVWKGFFSPTVLLVVFALPVFRKVYKVYTSPAPKEPPENYPKDAWPLWYVAFAFWHNRRFGMLYLLGLLLDAFLR